MRMSRLFSQTLREAPSEVETASAQLLLRAGFIRPLAVGIYSSLPLARRALDRIEAIIRQEMDAIGGQEISMPAVHPAELWQRSGRWYAIDAELGRFKDRSGRDLVLGMSHEEVAADLARREIRSYRQLPALIYQIQTKWRDDPRPRAGLIRVREFTMKDSYSFDADWEGLDRQYRSHYEAYFRIFRRTGIDVTAVKADTGMMGGKLSHEFIYKTPIGEDTIIHCPACGYAANRQVARFRSPEPEEERAQPVEKVATPECKTIEDLANFLGVPKSRTAKAVFFVAAVQEGQEAREQFVFAVVRGDMELNESLLAAALNARDLRPATEVEIRAVGAEPGYASPVGLRGVLVAADELVTRSPNLVAGANEAGYHLRNVNYGRDWRAQVVGALAAAREGDPCPECGAPLASFRGVEVGNIFQLGTRYSEALEATFWDQDGQEKPLIMGSYGIGVGRLLACVAEEHHDEHGLAWPVTVAPYPVHLVQVPGKTGQVESAAAGLYAELTASGLEPLFDDRPESAGVKFMDADLIGLPLRMTVGDRSLKNGGAELKLRGTGEMRTVSLEGAVSAARETLDGLRAEMERHVSGTI